MARTLTDEQQRVVRHSSGHALVCAAAGSGKTTAIVARVEHLVQSGVSPKAILVLAYNTSTQREFERRITGSLGHGAPPSRTFNSVGARITRAFEDAGILARQKLETSDLAVERAAKSALIEAWRGQHGSAARPHKEALASFVQFIGLVKAGLESPSIVFHRYRFKPEMECFAQAFVLFEKQRNAGRWMTFDDQLWRPLTHLAEHPEDWPAARTPRLAHLLVDEFQDANQVQFELMRHLAGDSAAVMAVGDHRQAIYGWRGGNVDLMLREFPRVFTPSTRLGLTRTFRFGHSVALMANHLISHNPSNRDELTLAGAGQRTEVTRRPYSPDKPAGFADLLAHAAQRHELGQCAILVRYFAQTLPIELELARFGIPHHVYRAGAQRSSETTALLGALCIATGHWGSPPVPREGLLRAMLLAPTLYLTGDVLNRAVAVMSASFDDPTPQPGEALLRVAIGADPRLGDSTALRMRALWLDRLASGVYRGANSRAIIGAWMTGTEMLREIERTSANAQQASERRGYVQAFNQVASTYTEAVRLIDDLGDLAASENTPPAGDHVGIYSIHSSKGLEWPTVILAGWDAEDFPRGAENAEEERRLAYVAITRAIERLVIFHPADASFEALDGRHQVRNAPAGLAASPFLYEARPGASIALATAIEKGDGKVELEAAQTASAYVRAVGAKGLVSPAPERPRRTRETSSPPSPPPRAQLIAPITRGRVLLPAAPGTRVFNAQHGAFTVAERKSGSFYRLRAEDGREIDADLRRDLWELLECA